MKHVNEPMPDVQEKRPEVSSALAAVSSGPPPRSPKKRYPDMASCSPTSRAALEVEVARAGGAHGEATTVLDSVPTKRRKLLTTPARLGGGRPPRPRGDRGGAADRGADRASKREPGAGARLPRARRLRSPARQAFDPSPGDGQEHDDELKLAIDGNPGTGWTTETYQAPTTEAAVGKPGVGLIVDHGPAGRRPHHAHPLRSRAAGARRSTAPPPDRPPTLQGWGKPIGDGPDVQTDSEIELSPRTAKYYLIWITKLAQRPTGYNVQINEVER